MENDRFSETLLQHEETPLCTSVEAQTGKVTSMPCGSGCGFSDVGNRTKDTQVRTEATKKLIIAVVLCLIFITVEVIGGLIANSLAILTDAAHLLSDVASFAISLFAIWAASWEATPRQTYGFFRLEILGALLSIQLIWLLTGILVYEAIDRILHHSKEVDGRLMFLIACIGLFFNMIMVFLFGHYGHDHSHGNHGHSHHSQGNDHDNDNAHRDHNHIRSHHYERIYHNEGSMADNGHSHGNRGHSHHSHGNDHANDNGRTDHSHGRSHHYERIYHSEGSIADVSLDIKHEHRQPDCTLHVNEAHVSLNDKRQEQHEVLIVEQDVEEGRHADHGNINVRGAYLHVFGDLIQSVGVMVGGAIIWVKPSWKVVDLICTLFFSMLVLSTTIKMMRDIVEILMESTPREIDATKLEKGLLAIPGVVAIHELHIWAITTGKTSLACHLRIDTEANPDIILKKAVEYCEKIFSISHVTVQIERN